MTASAARIEQRARDATRQTNAEDALRALAALRGELDALEPALVARALRGGSSWSRIARALGVSKQAAHRKHRDVLDREPEAGEEAVARMRVSAEARRCVKLARQEARALGRGAVGTEHLLLGILRCRTSRAAAVLRSLGVTIERARAELETTVVGAEPLVAESRRGPSLGDLGRRQGTTPHAWRIIEGALRQAVKLRDGFIGVEDLLLALVTDRRNGAVWTLDRLGVAPAQVRAELERTWTHAAPR